MRIIILMYRITRYWREITLAGLLLFAYFFLRLLNLTSLPIFTDEAIYLRWAQVSLHDASWRFISLTDGKQPMFIWIAMLFLKIIKDPLLAGRLVSVMAGFLTMAGIGLLSFELFRSKKTAYLTSLLYLVYPFAQVYDRMALYDSMVGTFSVWALYFSIRLVRGRTIGNAYTLGGILGGGVLTKTSAFFNLALLPMTFLLGNFNKKTWLRELVIWMVLVIFSICISLLMYTVLRLSPLFGVISIKNDTFVYPLTEWFKHPFTYFLGNLRGLTSWLLQYLGVSYTLLLLVGLGAFKKEWKEKTVLVIYFLVPFIYLALFGKVIFPRFIFFMSLMLLPVIGWALSFLLNQTASYWMKKNLSMTIIVQIIVIIIFIFHPVYRSLTFAINPINASIADADNAQYINGWNAGWGVNESISFFKQEAKDKKVFIGTEGTFGLMPFALEMYLVNNPNIVLKGYWGFDKTLPVDVLAASKTMPTYFIFYQPNHREQLATNLYPLKLVMQKQQGNTKYFFQVYQVRIK